MHSQRDDYQWAVCAARPKPRPLLHALPRWVNSVDGLSSFRLPVPLARTILPPAFFFFVPRRALFENKVRISPTVGTMETGDLFRRLGSQTRGQGYFSEAVGRLIIHQQPLSTG